MKIKAITTINLGVYMDIRPEIEIDVPDELSGPELVKWLHKEYFGLLDGWKSEPVPEKSVPGQGTAKALVETADGKRLKPTRKFSPEPSFNMPAGKESFTPESYKENQATMRAAGIPEFHDRDGKKTIRI